MGIWWMDRWIDTKDGRMNAGTLVHMLELRSCKPKQDNSTPNILGFRVLRLVRFRGLGVCRG